MYLSTPLWELVLFLRGVPIHVAKHHYFLPRMPYLEAGVYRVVCVVASGLKVHNLYKTVMFCWGLGQRVHWQCMRICPVRVAASCLQAKFAGCAD